MSVINTNYLALVSQNNLTKSQSALGTAIERLSSGMRINSAKDDAAGQAIANRFTANIKGLTQAARNANDGISIAQTTEGSLNEINNNLQRIRELSVQAANGSNSQTDLDSIQAEIQERLDEIDRVSQETQFNGKYVLGKDANEVMSVQVGAHDNQRIDIKLSRIDSGTLSLSSYNVNGTQAGDLQAIDASKSGSTGTTSVNATVQANSGAGSNTNPSGSGITAEMTGGKVNVYETNGGDYAVKASDGNYYQVTQNKSTDKWYWDTSDTGSIVAGTDIKAGGPLPSQEVSSTIDTTNAAAGFTDGAGNAGSAVTVTGGATPAVPYNGFNGDVTGIVTSALGGSAKVEGISFDSDTNTYYAEISGATDPADNGFYAIAVSGAGAATATLATGTAVPAGGNIALSSEIDSTAFAASLETTHGFDSGASITSIHYDTTGEQYYALIDDGGTNDGYYAVDVDANGVVSVTGTITPDSTPGQGSNVDPSGLTLTAVTHTVAAGGTVPAVPGVDIDFDAGLFARNDVAGVWDEATSTMTQQYAAKDVNGDFYAVEATFTLKAGATAGSTDFNDYDVAYTLDASQGGATQLSPQNIVGGAAATALTELTVSQGDFVAPEQNDLYNLEYTITADASGAEGTGLYAVTGNDNFSYAVKGSDGRYYGATVDEATGNVSWDSTDNDSVISAGIGAETATIAVEKEGEYTGLAAGETLHSYQNAEGKTEYVVKSGTGNDAVYTKATVGEADPATGNIEVTKASGDNATLSVRSEDPLAALDSALQKVDNLRSHLGAIQNRFESTIANLNNTVNNLSAARSRIEDADYAVEVSNMTRAQILQQAGTSVLAQANQIPQTVLSLLR